MKKLVVFVMLIALLVAGCGKSSWDEAVAHAPMAGLPQKLPQATNSGLRVTIYSDKPVTQEVKNLVDQGVMEELASSQQYTAKLGWDKYTRPSDYKVLIIDSQVLAESPDIAGCKLIDTYAGRAAGTVAGVWGNHVGDPVIIVPRQDNYDGSCGQLFKNGVRHEAEHVRLTNNMNFYTFFQGERDVHPIFVLWIFHSNTDIEPVEGINGVSD